MSRSLSTDQILCQLNPKSVPCSFVVSPSDISSQVVVDRIAVRIHLCADTGSALGLYFGDFGTAFKERQDHPYVFGFLIGCSCSFASPSGIESLSHNLGSQWLYQLRGHLWEVSQVRFNRYVPTFP